MTNTQIQIEIAKLMWWTELQEYNGHLRGLVRAATSPKIVPNYPTSLDACREFENNAPDEYWYELFTLITGHEVLAKLNKPLNVLGFRLVECCKATPLQRCEAFLRLHNKWIE